MLERAEKIWDFFKVNEYSFKLSELKQLCLPPSLTLSPPVQWCGLARGGQSVEWCGRCLLSSFLFPHLEEGNKLLSEKPLLK